MKKITTLLAACLVTSAGFAQSDRIWEGLEGNNMWDYTSQNWIDPDFDLFPTNFNAGDNAIFNDKVIEGAEALKLAGSVTVGNISFTASKDIKISRTTTDNYITDVVKGDGTLIKEGTGTFSLDVANELTGGCIVREGILKMAEGSSTNTGIYNPFGSKIILEGGSVDFASTKTTGANADGYMQSSTPIEISEGKNGTVILGAYSYYSGAFTGAGGLTLALEGERGYMGGRSSADGVADFSGYTNKNINVDFYDTGKASAALLVLVPSKTFDPDSPTYQGADSTFYDKSIILGPNAGIATESGTRAWVIGELKADNESSRIMGYRSNSNGPRPYWIVGGLNTDVVFKAKFASPSSNNYNANSFIKVGTGTYTFTNNNNLLQVTGLRIDEGKVLACDDVLRGQYSGSVGGNVLVNPNGVLGGTGRVQTHGNNGIISVYGKLEPGANGIGTLMIADSLAVNPLSKYETPFSYTANSTVFKNGGTNKQNLYLQASSLTEIEIKDVNNYDKLDIRGNLRFYTAEGNKPKIKVTIPHSYTINDGDEFEIFTAYTCTNEDNAETDFFDIEYPTVSGVTWSVEAKYEVLDTEVFNNIVVNIDGTDYTADEVTLENKRYRIIVKATGSASGIEEGASVSDVVAVYPNPTYGEVKVSANDVEISAVEIYSLQGQLVKSQTANGNEVTLQVSEIPSGVYFVKVYTTNGVVVQKLVKK